MTTTQSTEVLHAVGIDVETRHASRLVRVFVRATLRWCWWCRELAARFTCIVVGLAQTRGGAHTTDSINKPRPGL